MKTLPLASQETCAAMEFYHNQLKVRLLNEKDPGVYHRADWLVDKLGTKVHSYFWLDEYSEKDDFARYQKDEWATGLTSWRKALKILDADVVVEGRCAKVTDQLDRDRVHVVWNPGSEFAICDCSWAEMGNLCEHVFKVIKICRDKGHRKPSISLFQYNQALIDMLNCPPHDSLIRDHAVSLAVAVQKQLDALVDLDNSQTTVDANQKQAMNLLQQQIDGADSSNNKSHFMDKDASTHQKNDCEDRHEGPGGAEMDVDPSSICISPPGLHSVDEAVSSDVFTDNGDKVINNIGPDTNKSLHSKGDILIDQVGGEQERVMDVEPLAIDAPLSTTESPGQHTVMINQNDVCNNDPEPLVITKTTGASTLSDRPSPSMSKAAGSQMIGVSKSLPSKGDSLTDAVGCEQDSGMDVEPMAIDTLLSTKQSLEQPTVMTNPNDACINDPEPLVVTNKAGASASSDKTSPSLSEAAESHMIDIVETSCATKENEVMKSESGNGNGTQNHCSTDNDFSLNGGS